MYKVLKLKPPADEGRPRCIRYDVVSVEVNFSEIITSAARAVNFVFYVLVVIDSVMWRL